MTWMEQREKRSICTDLLLLIHECSLSNCPKFKNCWNDLPACLYHEPREVVRDSWEVWQYVLNAREKANGQFFPELREHYDEKKLKEIMAELDLGCEVEFLDGEIKFTI